MRDYRSPTVREMVDACQRAKAVGLKNIRLGNLGVFLKSREDQEYLAANIEPDMF